jgi:hypothetical protein
MANTFKNKVFGGGNVAANSDMSVYTCPTSTTTVVIGLTIANLSGNKIILTAGHSITAQSDTVNSCDVVMSIMEIT